MVAGRSPAIAGSWIRAIKGGGKAVLRQLSDDVLDYFGLAVERLPADVFGRWYQPMRFRLKPVRFGGALAVVLGPFLLVGLGSSWMVPLMALLVMAALLLTLAMVAAAA
jgi:hypothetical protein